MDEWIRFIIDGEPTALKRPRFTRSGIAYDSQKAVKKEHIKALMAQMQMYLHSKNNENRFKCGLLASSCDFHVRLLFCHSWPENATQAKRNALAWGFEYDHKRDSLSPHKSDIDNCIKYVFDVGNELLWRDDRQIVSITASKCYAKHARTVIMIKPIQKSYSLAQQILELFSPTDLATLMDALSHCDWEKMDDGEVTREAAILISKLAENFAKPLSTVAKKFPKAHEKIVNDFVDSSSQVEKI